MPSKQLFHQLFQDRTLIILTIVGTILGLVLIIGSLIQLHPSDIQLPVRYSAYGVTTLYREKWYHLLNFIAFGGILLLHPFITVKLLRQRGRQFAVGFGLLTTLVGIIAIVIGWAVFRLASYSI